MNTALLLTNHFKKDIFFTRCLRSFSSEISGENKAHVGLIGLGNMGGHMASRLVSVYKGEKLFFDVLPANTERFPAKFRASSVVALSKESDIIVTMLPATKHVQSVLRDGVFNHAKPGSLIIDCSTIDPTASKELHEEAESRGLCMLDAPVSGGVTGAAAGTLTFMVGGKPEVVNRAEEVLQCMGKNIVHCGGAGTGEITKLCNNLSLAISMIGTSEALSLGSRLGMDPVVLSKVMNTSTARCWSSDTYNPCPGITPNSPANRGYEGGFGSALMEKDLTLALLAAQTDGVKARLPLTASAHSLYGLLCEHGYGTKDFSVVFEYLMKSSKKD